jgi:hypothetical protein
VLWVGSQLPADSLTVKQPTTSDCGSGLYSSISLLQPSHNRCNQKSVGTFFNQSSRQRISKLISDCHRCPILLYALQLVAFLCWAVPMPASSLASC